MLAPSGEQVELALGEQRAVVVEVGGGLRDVLRSAAASCSTAIDADEMSTSGRGQVLIPWPNRIAGRLVRVRRPHAPARRSTSRGAATRSTASSAGRAGRSPSANRDRGRRGARVASAAGLSVRARALDRVRAVRRRACACGRPRRTSATDPCPFGSGAHPYLTRRARRRSTRLLLQRAGADACCTSDEHGIPTGSRAVDGTDVRLPRAPADRRDEARHRLHRPRARRRRSRARRAPRSGGGGGLPLWVDEPYRYLMLYTRRRPRRTSTGAAWPSSR